MFLGIEKGVGGLDKAANYDSQRIQIAILYLMRLEFPVSETACLSDSRSPMLVLGCR